MDTFTAANLLFFNRWSGQVRPAIPFYISKWIFAGCILLSWILLVYRLIRAVLVIRCGVIAVNYLDPLAVVIQSLRTGRNGRGWRRFLVFAELTKGRKGAEYVALFTYFSFEGGQQRLMEIILADILEAWLRIIFAEGPRQVINALTLYSVIKADLVPAGEHKVTKGNTQISQFFVNIQILANHNKDQAAILFGMLFTLVIWAVYALGLLIAMLSYLLFLLNHIPSKDNGLSNYCRRKVDSRLQKIVGEKINKALAKTNTNRMLYDFNAGRHGEPAQVKKRPTLPMLDTDQGKTLQDMPPPSRQTTDSTNLSHMSRQTSRTGSHSINRNGESAILDIFPTRPLPPSRSTTQNSAFSNTTCATKASLLREAAEMGNGPSSRNYSPAEPFRMRPQHSVISSLDRPLVGRSLGTQQSHNSAWTTQPISIQRTPGPKQVGPPSRQNTNISDFSPSDSQVPPPPIPLRAPNHTAERYFVMEENRRQTPGPQIAIQDFEMWKPDPPTLTDKYVAFNPHFHATPQLQTARSQPVLTRSATTTTTAEWSRPPMRNFTMPNVNNQPAYQTIAADQRAHQQQHQAFGPPQRSDTAPHPPMATGYNDDGHFYTGSEEPVPRAATAGPSLDDAVGWDRQQRSLRYHPS